LSVAAQSGSVYSNSWVRLSPSSNVVFIGEYPASSGLKSGLSLPAIASARHQPMGNSPLGKQVFLAGGPEQVCLPCYCLWSV
jgi:hypothetical protein